MAFSVTMRPFALALLVVSISTFCCSVGNAYDGDKPQTAAESFGYGPYTRGAEIEDDPYSGAGSGGGFPQTGAGNTSHTRVFFRGYSASHFRKVPWNTNSNVQCEGEKLPITNETELAPYPWMMRILETVISEMKTPVFYLNITRMTDFKKDGHPSVYRQPEIRRALE